MTIVCLRVSSNLIISGWRGETKVVSIDRRWIFNKRVHMTILVSACQRARLPLDDKGGRWPWVVSVCYRTQLSLDSEVRLKYSLSIDIESSMKGCRWPYWSLHVNGLACLWMTKVTDDHELSPRVIKLNYLWMTRWDCNDPPRRYGIHTLIFDNFNFFIKELP